MRAERPLMLGSDVAQDFPVDSNLVADDPYELPSMSAPVWQLRGRKEELLGVDGFQSLHTGGGRQGEASSLILSSHGSFSPSSRALG